MSAGTLITKVVLNEPGKVHCGTRDPVMGHVRIGYFPRQSTPNTELFGHLKVFVTLHGRAKTKIWKSNGQGTSVYRGRAPLFAQKVLLYDDSFRAQPGELAMFPFSLVFPVTTDAQAIGINDFPDQDTKFVCDRNQPLPPSYQAPHQGIGHRYEAFVEYRVGVDVVMPQLPVEVEKPTKYQEPVVHYEGPSAFQPVSRSPWDWKDSISVNNELLLPESERPSGFKEKTKALFGTRQFPTYAFDWVCLAPRDIYLGQPLCFEVHIQPRESECTAALIPEVRLEFFHVEIKAHAYVRAHKVIFRTPDSEGHSTVFQMNGIVDTAEPFSKANGNTKIITTRAIGNRGISAFSSSFATYNIVLAYTVKISFALSVTKRSKKIEKEYVVVVHPPLDTAPPPSPAAEAGPSSEPVNTNNKISDLPPYEPPPTYEKTSSDNT
ncbi:hypothetical protein F4861DRAFT_178133 [Xylaria intraflava]|nr:hypothetical protein F4861DRAFT_178133 [Xylaria intraflava]